MNQAPLPRTLLTVAQEFPHHPVTRRQGQGHFWSTGSVTVKTEAKKPMELLSGDTSLTYSNAWGRKKKVKVFYNPFVFILGNISAKSNNVTTNTWEPNTTLHICFKYSIGFYKLLGGNNYRLTDSWKIIQRSPMYPSPSFPQCL